MRDPPVTPPTRGLLSRAQRVESHLQGGRISARSNGRFQGLDLLFVTISRERQIDIRQPSAAGGNETGQTP